MKAFIVANTHSGKGEHSLKQMTLTCEALQKRGYKNYIYITEPNSQLNIKKVTENVNNFTLLVCIGGDGTLNETLNGYMLAQSKTPMLYIPCGSTNDFARTLGLQKDPFKAVERIAPKNLKQVDVGCLNGRYFSYVAATGVFSEVSYATSRESKHKLGHLAYLIEGLRSLGNIKPIRLKITSDGSEWEDNYLVGIVANATSVGGVFHLKKLNIALDDGLFEVVLIKEPANHFEYTTLFFDMIAENYKNKNVRVFNTKNLLIQSEEAVRWSLDGEFGGAFTNNHIEICRKALNIYQ